MKLRLTLVIDGEKRDVYTEKFAIEKFVHDSRNGVDVEVEDEEVLEAD